MFNILVKTVGLGSIVVDSVLSAVRRIENKFSPTSMPAPVARAEPYRRREFIPEAGWRGARRLEVGLAWCVWVRIENKFSPTSVPAPVARAEPYRRREFIPETGLRGARRLEVGLAWCVLVRIENKFSPTSVPAPVAGG